MKKKIMALCICVAMLAIALIGGTLAYFTDKEEKTNVFAVGDIDIELNEEAAVLDKNGDVIDGRTTQDENGASYTNLMPTNQIVKKHTVVNTGSNAAYVRVTVDINNAYELNQAIDQVYENIPLTQADLEAGFKTVEDKTQAVYDYVFNGWGINYNPRPGTDGQDGRCVIDDPSKMAHYDAKKVIDVDFTKTCASNNNFHHIFGIGNMFMNDAEKAAKKNGKFELYPTTGEFNGYYTNGMEDMVIRYTYYLMLDPKEEFTLFDGLNVPADFDNNRKVVINGKETVIDQMAFFEGLNIEIKADAIQVEGFDTAEEAFEALEAAHPMS